MSEILRISGQMIILGVLIGLGAGTLLEALLTYVYNNKLVEGSLIIGLSCAPYMTFPCLTLPGLTLPDLALLPTPDLPNPHLSHLLPPTRLTLPPSTLPPTSYMTFWVAEILAGSSAVLAVVVMGLYMNTHKSVISGECYEFLHEVGLR